jgi:hypothetical protein
MMSLEFSLNATAAAEREEIHRLRQIALALGLSAIPSSR